MALTLHRSVCDHESGLEKPPCADGHGSECPDFACAKCGMAFVIGDAPESPVIVTAQAA